MENKTSGGTVIDSYSYTYDPAGNQLSKTDAKGVTHYEYDSLNRLKKVTEPNGRITEYTFDKAGNRKTEKAVEGSNTTTTAYEYNSQNRLMSLIKESSVGVKDITKYTYDHNGNMTYQAEETIKLATPGLKPTFGLIIIGHTENEMSRRVAHYTYNVFNQLISAKTAGTTAQYVYNGEGLRVQKTVNGETTLYLYEYDKVVLELDLNGSVKARSIYGLNLLARQVDGEKYYYMYNGHADVTVLLDAASGLVAASYYYDAFGNILEETGSIDNPIRYAGYQYDEETELYYLNARMYDPKIARFLQEDTYRGNRYDPLSLHLYAYAVNNPIRYWDPTGHYYEARAEGGYNSNLVRDVEEKLGNTVTWSAGTGAGSSSIVVTDNSGSVVRTMTEGVDYTIVNGRAVYGGKPLPASVTTPTTTVAKDTGNISSSSSAAEPNPTLAQKVWAVVDDFREGFMQGTTEVVSYREYVSPPANSFAQHLGQVTGIVNTTVLVVTTEFAVGSSATTLGVAASGPTGGTSLVISAGGVAVIADAAAHATAGVGALFAKVSGGGSSSTTTQKEGSSVSTSDVPEYVKDDRVPADKETVLGDRSYQKTKIPKEKGATVYKKDGLYYHRDTLHWGEGAHLEVYNSRGIHIGEANPQTGEIIQGTADPTKRLNIR